ncbi:MAG: MopE-related protein [Bacteroidota bacterium]
MKIYIKNSRITLALGFVLCFLELSLAQGKLELQPNAFLNIEGLAFINYTDTQLNNSGIWAPGVSNVVFKTNKHQDLEISGTSTTSFHKLNIDMGENKLKLKADIEIENFLKLISGNIDLNGQHINMAPEALLLNESGANYITGILGGELSIIRDLNMPANENPGNLGLALSSGNDLGLTQVRRGHESQNVGIDIGINRWFEISPINNSDLDATLRFYYFDSELNGIPECELGLWKLDNGVWVFMGYDHRDLQENWVELEDVDSFSRWTLAPTAPDAICTSDTIKTQLNSNAQYIVDPNELDNGSMDDCGIQSLQADPAMLNCHDVGFNTVALIVTDVNGFQSSCNVVIEIDEFLVLDSIDILPESCIDSGDGSIIINATVGSGQLSYSIDGGINYQLSNTFNNLIPGVYEVVIKVIGVTPVCEKYSIAVINAGEPEQIWFQDLDGDGYSNGGSVLSCNQPSNYYLATDLLSTMGDCDDSEPTVYPAANELCDGLDNNCDGQLLPDELDNDGDGYLACGGDCDDSDFTVHPGATEICNGIDDNCDGYIDEGATSGLTYMGNLAFYTQVDVDAFSQCYSVVDGNLIIQGSNITNLLNLSKLVEVSGNLTIQYTGLADLDGLDSLKEVGGALNIYFNASLTSLDGLNAINTLGGSLMLYYNFSLSDCCPIYDLINGGVTGTILIFFNAVGCNGVAEINTNCGPQLLQANLSSELFLSNYKKLEFSEMSRDNRETSFQVFPNPAVHKVEVVLSEEIHAGVLRILSGNGVSFLEVSIQEGTKIVKVEVENWKPGVYFVQLIKANNGLAIQRLVIIRY